MRIEHKSLALMLAKVARAGFRGFIRSPIRINGTWYCEIAK